MSRTFKIENIEVIDENDNFVLIKHKRNFQKIPGVDELRERLPEYFTQDGERLNSTPDGYETPDGRRKFLKVV